MSNVSNVQAVSSIESHDLYVFNKPNWIDISLLVVSVASMIISGLAFFEVFDAIGTLNAFYLCQGTYILSLSCIVAEIIKLTAGDVIKKKNEPEKEPDLKSFDSIKEVHIDTACEKDPCQHNCLITLEDGTAKTMTLWGTEADFLLKTLGSEKCHFANTSSNGREHFQTNSSDVYSVDSERLLQDIFSENIAVPAEITSL